MAEKASLLRRLLVAGGYRLEERPEGLLATRTADQKGLLLVAGTHSTADLERVFPTALIHRTLVYAEEPGSDRRREAAERGLEVVDPASLGPALGEILLVPSASTAPSAPSTLEPPATVLPEGERVVRPRIGRAEAEAIAGVDGFRYTLRFVPYYVVNYRVRAASPHGGAGRLSDHQVAANALSGLAEWWEPGDREMVSDVQEPHQRLEPLLTEAELRPSLVEAVRQRHTVSVDHSEQHGGALIIERRRVPPGPDDVRFGPVVLVHVPFWYIEGPEGRIVVDAVQGVRLDSEAPDRRD